jgi:hypothetical protein
MIKDGMEIKLTPFHDSYSRERHAGFTVLVAGECTDTHNGPFNQAIRSEYELWRDNLRNNYRKILSKSSIPKSEYTDP